MSQSQATRQFHFVTVPRAHGASGPTGQVAVFQVGTAGKVLDLTKLTFGEVTDLQQAMTANLLGPGVEQDYITIEADGQDLGIVFGPTLASVTGANVPSLTAYGSVDGNGIYTGVSGTCFRLFASNAIRVIPCNGPTPAASALKPNVYQGDQFMGLVMGATGTVRIYQSSPDSV
jgi:hypothetical protein